MAKVDKTEKQKTKGKKRSRKWRKVRNAFKKKHPFCAGCGRKTFLQIHHIVPFHVAPELELRHSNLITLCEKKNSSSKSCHFIFGHLYSWRSYNEDIKTDSKIWKKKIKQRP